MGYYPYGDKTFSNLTHYVRSGDFVVNLFRNARNADELAFAVGRCLTTWRLYRPLRSNQSFRPVEFPVCVRNTVAR